MNAERAEAIEASTVDDGNPWIGLASFTEETRGYFYGREEEIAELARRVQRKLLTVLFGQSGLGKTSILRAGLVPRLRGQGYCPIYVRVDYSHEAPEPAEQIKQAIFHTARHAGQWTQAGVAAEGETLWEFLHHRDDVLQDESGDTLIPLLIFDQFEEVFTLAQTDEFGRARAARFLADLADLVENRAPQSLEARLEADDTTAERFDFARSDYRVLISLREDYLAPLEGLKARMPSVTQNRLRLARMTGTQALAAVLRPGKGLVTEDVAAAIVRFVAGGAELANAEVEPSLLSLICRELNDTRIAEGRAEISLDLLAGSHATILSNFYERALSDQPPAVRRIIEDELLTESGFRENVAEERLQKSFANAGAAPDTLSVLVNRRLLRIEERLDVRRVELTHDVLCGVVQSSRDIRHERESREATERMLAEQRERELSARHALVRARQVATVCIVLALGAVAAAVYAYWSSQRAKRAETLAQQSRVQAEQLLGYLTDDFARELESFGRLDVVASLAKREVDYFHALPDELKGPTTVRTGAIAMVQYARASRSLGRLDAARSAVAEARSLLEGLRRSGDESDATVIALARALSTNARIMNIANEPGALAESKRAIDLLNPVAGKPNAQLAVREAHLDVLVQYGYQQQSEGGMDQGPALATLRRAMDLAEQLGARTLTSFYAADKYAEAAAWIVQATSNTGKTDEARRVGALGRTVAEGVLATRPSDMSALYALGVIQSSLAYAAIDEMRPALALEDGLRGVEVQATLVRLDGDNTISRNNLAVSRSLLGDASWTMGRTKDALHYYEEVVEDMQSASRGGAALRLTKIQFMAELGRRYAEAGNLSAAARLRDEISREAAILRASEPKQSPAPLWAEAGAAILEGRSALIRGDARAALKAADGALARVDAANAQGSQDVLIKELLRYSLHAVAGRAELMLGDFASSEQSFRAAIAARQAVDTGTNLDRQEIATEGTLLALALVGHQRTSEARQELAPVLRIRRDLDARNHGDEDFRAGLASTLYVQALVDGGRRAALLKESASILDALPEEMRKLHYVRTWRERVREAMR